MLAYSVVCSSVCLHAVLTTSVHDPEESADGILQDLFQDPDQISVCEDTWCCMDT